MTQSTLRLQTGQEWMCSNLVKELLGKVVELTKLGKMEELWEEWPEEGEGVVKSE